MELMLALIALALLLAVVAGVVLGPVAFFRLRAFSRDAEQSIRGLQSRVAALTRDLQRAHQRLADLETPGTRHTPPDQAPGTTEPGATEPDEANAAATQPEDSEQAEPEPDAMESEPASAAIEAPRPPQTMDALRRVIDRERERGEPIDDETPDATEPAVSEVAPTAPTDQSPVLHEKRLTLEEVLAGKIFIWIGAVALVLTAAFLLKLGFDRNIITEPVRVITAGVFGLVLWCVGEWARKRVPLIAQVLCGAAVAVLYGTILAGQNYELFGSRGGAVAFGLMVVVTGAAVLLSLRHGPTVAILGMLGGFMLPPVLAEDFAGPSGGMVLYLLALEIGILAVTGRRGWFGIGLLTLVFTTIWSIAYTVIGSSATDRTLTAMLVVGTAVAYLVHTARIHRDASAERGTRRRAAGLAIGAVCSAVAVVALLIPRGGYTPRDLWMLGLITTGVLALARIDRRYRALPLTLLGLVTLILLAALGARLVGEPATASTVTGAAIGFGLLFMVSGYLCLWGSSDRKLFALLSAVAGPTMFAVLILANREAYGLRTHWWPGGLMLSAVYGLAAVPIYRKRSSDYDGPLTIYTLASFLMLCVAIMQGMDHPRIAICLALVSAVAALIDRRWFIRPLLLTACGTSAVSAAMLILPGPFTIDIKGTLILNALLPMYLLPALSFGIIAWCATSAGEARLARVMTWLSAGTVAALLLGLTRHAFFPDRMDIARFHLYEWSTAGGVLMLGGWLGLHIAARFRLQALRASAIVVGTGGALIAFIGAFTVGNPIFRGDASGGGGLMLGLVALDLLPALLIMRWSRLAGLEVSQRLRDALRVMPWVLIAAFVGLQIRNAFHASDLHALTVGMFECSTYAIAWMLLGGVLRRWAGDKRAGDERADHPIRTAGRAIACLGLATALVGNLIVLNPLWNAGSVGRLIALNGLWYLIGPSILGLALLARAYRRRGNALIARCAGLAAVGVGFLLVCLLVRQGFSADGVLMLDSRPGSGERYAYSLAWVLFGSLLLIGGIATRLDTLRYGSLAVLLVAVGKVFLIDTASLDNLYRVMSFFGLGVTLIALGYLYQRLVFRKDTRASTQPAESAESDGP